MTLTSLAAKKMVASIGFQSIAFVFNSMMTFRLLKNKLLENRQYTRPICYAQLTCLEI